jgi:hypothetical protein
MREATVGCPSPRLGSTSEVARSLRVEQVRSVPALLSEAGYARGDSRLALSSLRLDLGSSSISPSRASAQRTGSTERSELCAR